MTMEIFLLLLLITSSVAGLATEGIKKLLDEKERNYSKNALAGYVSLALSVLVGGGYVILFEIPLDAKLFVYLIALMLLSWLCAMVGYDKVIQTISQFKVEEK